MTVFMLRVMVNIVGIISGYGRIQLCFLIISLKVITIILVLLSFKILFVVDDRLLPSCLLFYVLYPSSLTERCNNLRNNIGNGLSDQFDPQMRLRRYLTNSLAVSPFFFYLHSKYLHLTTRSTRR